MNGYLEQFDAPAGYLDFAAIGPPGRMVRSAVADAIGAIAGPEVPITEVLDPMGNTARGTIARFLGAEEDHATYVFGTSEGLFHAAFGLIAADGNVVVPAGEFPSNIYPWLRAEAAGGPEVRLVEPGQGRITAELLAEAIDAETRAVSVSLVDYNTGFRADIEAIAAVVGEALLIVDAIQGLGAVRTGLGAADVFVAGGQKWLRAGFGAGVMAVSDRALEVLEPTLTGWWGVENAFSFHEAPPHSPQWTAERFHFTAPDPVGAAAAAAAMATIELIGIDVIEQAVLERSEAIEEGLRRLGAEVQAPWRHRSERAGIVSFTMPGVDPEMTVKRLVAEGFFVSERALNVRVSAHASTPMSAIEAFLESLGDQVRTA
jgi:selenocysteine lyase/cysteine desulfurase